MNSWTITFTTFLAGQLVFQEHRIDEYPGGYQVAIADVNRDGRLDVVALATQGDRVDWYENPSWVRRPVAQTARNIDLAAYDIDGDGRVELAVATGFHFDDSSRGGEIFLLGQPPHLSGLWTKRLIATDPVVHRLRWGDVDGDGRKELIHASIFGPGSKGAKAPKPAHLWAFQIPRDWQNADVRVWKIDESLTVLHGLWVGDLDGDGRDEILTASFEGIHRFDLDTQASEMKWKKTWISPGAPAVSDQPGASRGSSEVVPVRLPGGQQLLAAIEPWHGNQVVVYWPDAKNDSWHRQVLDDTLQEGHALLAADLDGDGADEIVAGWRGGRGGLRLYDLSDTSDRRFETASIAEGVAVEGAAAADLNSDGRLDLVIIGGRTKTLAWYENRGRPSR